MQDCDFDLEIRNAEKDFAEALLGPFIKRIIERMEEHLLIKKGVKMLYQEACQHLMKGDYVSREKWDSECGYLVNLPGLQHFLKVMTQPESKVLPWAAVKEDSLADDWKVVVPNKCDQPAEEAKA